MNEAELNKLLERLTAGWENEVVEFKNCSRHFPTDEIGRYFSALSNEANLRGAECAWLVLGVDNKTRSAPGCGYPCDKNSLDKPGGLKVQILEGTGGLSFAGIYVLPRGGGDNVIFFRIPAAPQGMPVPWKRHYYARAGENVVALGLDKLDAIRGQGLALDWSAQTVEGTAEECLDASALALARSKFADKYNRTLEIDDVAAWPVEKFLDKLHLLRNGKLTRAAIILLGKSGTSMDLLSPYSPQLVWKLVGEECANEIFHPPFILATTELYSRIRNVQVRVLPEDEMLATEVPKYNQKGVLEALNNCIAHQDYSRGERIIVTEYVDRLTFWNGGSFFEGEPADYIPGSYTPRRYRNPLLASAMRDLNMIDTLGYGIHAIYVGQARRYFPLPDYRTTDTSVEMTMYGHIVDNAYSTLLIRCGAEMRLDDILLLDRVQKGLRIDAESARRLRRAGFVEGRAPNLRVSAEIASMTGREVDYVKSKRMTGRRLQSLIKDYLAQWKTADRKKINELLVDEFPVKMPMEDRISKITNIIAVMRRNGEIENSGTDRNPIWRLTKTNDRNGDESL